SANFVDCLLPPLLSTQFIKALRQKNLDHISAVVAGIYIIVHYSRFFENFQYQLFPLCHRIPFCYHGPRVHTTEGDLHPATAADRYGRGQRTEINRSPWPQLFENCPVPFAE